MGRRDFIVLLGGAWASARTARASRMSLCIASFIFVSASAICPQAKAAPNYFEYQVPFPSPPPDGYQAVETLSHRAEAVLTAVACGNELQFASNLRAGVTGEDSSALLVGKMEWLAGHPNAQGQERITNTICRFTRTLTSENICDWFKGSCDGTKLAEKNWTDLRAGKIDTLNDSLEEIYKPDCGAALEGTGAAPNRIVTGSRAIDQFVQVDFAVSRSCMRAQINMMLLSMSVQQTPGTAGIPCLNLGPASGIDAKSRGDWDMTVADLTRIAYLDKRYKLALLDPPARSWLHEKLLTLDGGPAEERYPPLGCGNTEESTGTSQERADERDWIDDLGDSLGDFLKWLLFIILIIIAIIVSILTLGSTLVWWVQGLILLGTALIVVAVAAAVVVEVVPETENHLLMINTSKYLKNQFIIGDLGAGTDSAEDYETAQSDLREWLLKRMQGFIRRDFIEYNSRPYQRLSMKAILNIADFADDADLRDGARLVLDYTTAKFSLGSSQGRRLVPFRRKREMVAPFIDVSDNYNGLFDLIEGADYQIALGLYYSGQTHQLRGGSISMGAAGQAVYSATSYYHPEPFVIDLAIRKDGPIYQRIYHHSTGEIYSSAKGYLISAGGIQTGPAYSIFGIGKTDDKGVALPIVLFLAGRELPTPTLTPLPAPVPLYVDRTTLGEFIRITGRIVQKVDHDDGKTTILRSYDHNLCVWDGFACGLNVKLPAEFDSCKTTGPSGWTFIDTSLCASYIDAPRSFIAIYREACRNVETGCSEGSGNFGFFEIVDATPAESFDAFKSKVITANPAPFPPGEKMAGVYHSVRNQTIVFDCEAHQNDSDKWGIVSVDGTPQPDLPDWPFAAGGQGTLPSVNAVMTGSGDGLLHIWNPKLNWKLNLDFRSVNAPMRTLIPPPP